MSDLISRQALLDEYDKHHVGAPGGARKLIEEAPAVDAVPVVRCKDCLYYHNDISGIPFCEIWDDCFTDDDGYCYRGERKADA